MMDNKDVWATQEAIAKTGYIDQVAPFLIEEFHKRVTRDIDPNIDLRQLFISTYDKDASYTLPDILTHFVIMFNQFDIKAKALK